MVSRKGSDSMDGIPGAGPHFESFGTVPRPPGDIRGRSSPNNSPNPPFFSSGLLLLEYISTVDLWTWILEVAAARAT